MHCPSTAACFTQPKVLFKCIKVPVAVEPSKTIDPTPRCDRTLGSGLPFPLKPMSALTQYEKWET